ncbi:hypothetical protein Droror1_Dr00007139 [Drosera rotundifolia]
MRMELPAKTKLSCPPSLSLPPPSSLPTSSGLVAAAAKRKVETWSATKQEIERFWRRKQMEQEDHLLSASKAAARIKAQSLTLEDYVKFEESLKEEIKMEDYANDCHGGKDQECKEIRIGIKDWWTKSKYAYLNQPAMETTEKPRQASSYMPNNCSFYKPPASVSNHPAHQLGVF